MTNSAKWIWVWMVALVLACTVFLIEHQKKIEQGTKMTLQSILGTSLFQIWSHYTDILELKSMPLHEARLAEVRLKLAAIEAYSRTADEAVRSQLLNPIAGKFLALSDSIRESYAENGEFSEEDIEKYAIIMKDSEALISLMYKVYYVSDSVEGGEVNLDISDYDELVALNNRLKHDLNGFAKK
ncbi:hypothetical protein SAMN04488688_104144 [Paenibacillus sp. cl141a]|uniref:hypothetical protein n=1 Tax=Paenibacillus sp. cl141a TaxID=1761877 RepID=UPI0008AD3FE7|nr:hypothetical protein [Paenibacillus sp. cl141a]SEL47474.1 hypothetical protein SAMN04488688_104144 [Paenibacillus sp. cl141a]